MQQSGNVWSVEGRYGLSSLRSFMGLGFLCLIAILFLGPEVGKLYYTLKDMLGSMSRVSTSDLGWVLRIHISNNFPGDADAVGLRATL